MRKQISFLVFAVAALSFQAQTTKSDITQDLNQTGGVYYAYPTPSKKLSKAPAGYEPFYISHYGRHGSRWLINDTDFFEPLETLRKAQSHGALTNLGESALTRLESIWLLAKDHNGDLTQLGAQQQKQISKRMIQNNPTVFQGSPRITAKSTLVPRCILSMAYFSNELIANNSKISVQMESSDKYMKFLNHHTQEANDFRSATSDWQEEKRKFKVANLQPSRFVKALFSDSNYAYKHVNGEKLMEAFYWIASDMQNISSDISFYDLFTPDELFDFYQFINYQTYVNDGASPLSGGLVKKNAIPLVKNILNEADAYITSGGNGATLRFGHDGNILPLLSLLDVQDAGAEELDPAQVYQVWNTFKYAPMGGNLQLIFYKNKQNAILVKFLLHENEVHIPIETNSFPFYSWESVKTYLESKTKG